MSQFVYAVGDFPTSRVNVLRLSAEIRDSSITVALDGDPIVDLPNCTINFKADLSNEEQTALDEIVERHSGEPLPSSDIQLVKAVDAEGLDPEDARSLTEGVDVETVVGQRITERLISFTYPVDFVAAQYVMDDEHWEKGDKLEVSGIAAGDPHVDAVIAAAYIGDNWIMASGTIFDYVKKGYLVKFGDEPEEYRIKDYDTASRRVTLSSPLTKDVPVMSLIRPRRPFVVNHSVKQGVVMRVGDLTSGSSKVDTGDVVRIRYVHKTAPTEVYSMDFDMILLI